jgi:hypothetical protein
VLLQRLLGVFQIYFDKLAACITLMKTVSLVVPKVVVYCETINEEEEREKRRKETRR